MWFLPWGGGPRRPGDAEGEYHSIAVAKDVKVVVEYKLVFHRQTLDRYTDKQIHDLTAYLVTLK